MERISKEQFQEMLNNSIQPLVFGKSGIGKTSMITIYAEQKNIPVIFFDEQNQAEPETLNNLYNMTRQKHTHTRKRIPYKYGKHRK